MQHVESEITDLKSSSMKDNIFIHNLAYTPGEKLDEHVPQILKENLGVDAKFVRKHRNSAKGTVNSRRVTITRKLVDRQRDELLREQKGKRGRVNLPFFDTAPEPASIVEERKRLYEILDSMRKQNIKTKVEKGAW